MNKHHNVIVVAGPTASGKSDFAVELAKKHNGEIISADSRQIYKGLDIGTGKITQEEMRGVAHHMLDICDINESFSVAEYKKHAMPILEDIINRGKTPIICGGTGQYIDALIYTQEIPEVEPNHALRNEFEQKSVDELYKELLQKDARRAEGIDKHNKVRIIRALEIIAAIGSVPLQCTPTLMRPTDIYVMNPNRELLRTRITNRLYTRLEVGMIEETISLLKKIDTMHTNSKEKVLKKCGLEYVAIAKYLQGEIVKEEMCSEIITKSMQYTKRQQTWNKKYANNAVHVPVEK